MPIERRNPLPVGRYWIWIQANHATAFEAWLASNANTVKVERSDPKYETDLSSPLGAPIGTPGTTAPQGLETGEPIETFYIFAVTAPTPWAKGCGLPNIAPSTVNKPSDTVQRPDQPTVLDELPAISAGFGSAFRLLGWAVGAVVAVELWRTFRDLRDKR